jgi:uncharacterized OB-fold protein
MTKEDTIEKKACKRCGHTWFPRKEQMPVICPKCFSPYWNRERERPRRTEINEKGVTE